MEKTIFLCQISPIRFILLPIKWHNGLQFESNQPAIYSIYHHISFLFIISPGCHQHLKLLANLTYSLHQLQHAALLANTHHSSSNTLLLCSFISYINYLLAVDSGNSIHFLSPFSFHISIISYIFCLLISYITHLLFHIIYHLSYTPVYHLKNDFYHNY